MTLSKNDILKNIFYKILFYMKERNTDFSSTGFTFQITTMATAGLKPNLQVAD